MKNKLPDFSNEKELWRKGYVVVGCDEVGRGAFAGPLVVGGVVFDKLKAESGKWKIENLGINDSKKLSPRRREELSEIIKKECLCYATASVPVSVINRVGIGAATGIAVRKIIQNLRSKLEDRRLYLLMDAFYIKYVKGLGLKHQKAIKHGDEVSLSIAAASIIAKVERDSYMENLAKKYPKYGFENHVGYGTAQHQTAIETFGATKIHRLAFLRNLAI